MSEIKILVACHKDSYVPENGVLKAIQVGAARGRIGGMTYHDDDGENISDKNGRYCELTAQYWAWKNLDCDYYGFCHYRRYLSFSTVRHKSDEYKNVYFPYADDRFVREFGLDEASIRKAVESYDIIVPEPMDIRRDSTLVGRKTVYTHYKLGPGHDVRDFEWALGYIKNNLPEYYPAAVMYSKSRYGYFLNSYVMKKELFFEYCEWLFPILEAFDGQKDYSGLDALESRAAGFLAERLFGVYLTHLKDARPELKIRTVQQSLLRSTDDPYPKPFMPENNIAVCLGCDDKYVPLAGNVIQSIIANASAGNFYDIFVMTNNVTEFSRERLRYAVLGHSNISLRFVEGGGYLNKRRLYEKHHINRSTYLRFSMLDFMRYYDKAVYLDCDLVVCRDIAELFNTDVAGYFFAGVRDTVQAGWISAPSHRKYNVETVGLKDPFDYFNAGVLVMNLNELRGVGHSSESLYILAESAKWKWQDQDVLNFIAGGVKTLFLDQSWNVMVHGHADLREAPEYNAPKSVFDAYISARKNPYIVHYAGRCLPCFCSTADIPEYFWSYARQSVFYEKLLWMMTDNHLRKGDSAPRHGFWRRTVLKLCPKGTRRYRFFKRLYHIFKR